jgi:hypothetical protein
MVDNKEFATQNFRVRPGKCTQVWVDKMCQFGYIAFMLMQMVDKLKNRDEVLAHEKEWGGFNSPPPGFQEITEQEFASSGFFVWAKTEMEFRQLDPNRIDQSKLLSPITCFFDITLFYMNQGEHYGIARGEGKVRYFKFAKCFHTYRELTPSEIIAQRKTPFNCYHYCVCTKCGEQWEYDSSG